MAKLSIRVDLVDKARIGPGKVALLEQIEAQGSISGAGRALGMSYRRAWELVADLNAAFGAAVVETQPGGRSGGGAKLTSFGRNLVIHYRAIEAKAEEAAAGHLKAIEDAARS